jgi:hypothetical protein
MKKSELKQIIKEEIKKSLNEMYNKDLIGLEYSEGGQHKIYNYDKDKVIKFNYSGEGEIGDNLKIFHGVQNMKKI